MADERKTNEGIQNRSQIHSCKKCETCDQKCNDHSSVVDFKEDAKRDFTTIFTLLEVMGPELARLGSYVKIGGTIACILLLALCVMTFGSYKRLNEFIITHSGEEATEKVISEKLALEMEYAKKRLDKLEDK